MARKAFVPTEADRKIVHSLAGLGVPQEDIAVKIGCSAKTLRKHFRNDLDLGEIEANAAVAGHLFNAIKDGNVTAMIFWLKTRAGWSDTAPIEDTRPKVYTVILPDNGRDPELTGVRPKLKLVKS